MTKFYLIIVYHLETISYMNLAAEDYNYTSKFKN